MYRYLQENDFLKPDLWAPVLRPMIMTTVVFASTHVHWLAAGLCGVAYQFLVCRQRRMGDVIVAHALTNLMLSIYVIRQGAWYFW